MPFFGMNDRHIFPETLDRMSIERNEHYKTFGDFKYHLNMPDEWILNELPHTGRECGNCVGNRQHGDCNGFAMWRGIILGYCANCAIGYEGKRGRGFMGLGNESNMFQYPSAFQLYLGYVDFENYGDLAENEEHTIENRNGGLEDIIMDYEHDEDHDSEPEDHYYGNDDIDDTGECLKIGCCKPMATNSAYCPYHARMFEQRQ
jgi:hypothetical protein